LQLIFLGANLVLCAFFFVFFYLYIRRRTGRESILTASREEVNRLIAEIDRATDRDARLVEERITALRKILEEADHRIALLSRDLDRRRASTELYTALGKTPPAVPGLAAGSAAVPGTTAGPPAPSPPAPSGAVPGIPAGSSVVSIAAPSSPSAVSGLPGAPGAPPAAPSLTGRVAELSRQGFAADLIAARLGLSLSEVELAITVSRRREA
jgi:hypothetical protein